jgi:hypothetical protein
MRLEAPSSTDPSINEALKCARSRVVGRAILNNDEFVGGAKLRTHCAEAAFEGGRAVVHRNDEAQR